MLMDRCHRVRYALLGLVSYLTCAGDLVAHTKFAVLLMPNGSDKVTSHPLLELQPTKTIDGDT